MGWLPGPVCASLRTGYSRDCRALLPPFPPLLSRGWPCSSACFCSICALLTPWHLSDPHPCPPMPLPRWLSPARESCLVTEILFPPLRASVQPRSETFPSLAHTLHKAFQLSPSTIILEFCALLSFLSQSLQSDNLPTDR